MKNIVYVDLTSFSTVLKLLFDLLFLLSCWMLFFLAFLSYIFILSFFILATDVCSLRLLRPGYIDRTRKRNFDFH